MKRNVVLPSQYAFMRFHWSMCIEYIYIIYNIYYIILYYIYIYIYIYDLYFFPSYSFPSLPLSRPWGPPPPPALIARHENRTVQLSTHINPWVSKRVLHCRKMWTKTASLNYSWDHYPFAPCMVYLPVFTYIWVIFRANVGKYSIHWAYGL